jgi:hypothetical protein
MKKLSLMVLLLTLICLTSFCQSNAKATAVQPVKANAAAVDQTPANHAAKTISVSDAMKASQDQPKQQKLIVYYFRYNARCPTCFLLESLAKSEVEADFADAIKKGTLEWKTINVEEKGNEHFNNDYKLYTKSIIVSTRQGDKELSWKNLDQIWQLVHNEQAYREYIRNEVAACLAGKCL